MMEVPFSAAMTMVVYGGGTWLSKIINFLVQCALVYVSDIYIYTLMALIVISFWLMWKILALAKLFVLPEKSTEFCVCYNTACPFL